mmetsp:Transcript_16995/g.50949  ORF Transcript_16995/g.50949 Transcript_16995/m.50949 type:complete len:207 (+) Transcript_16995:1027-1647(+)
MRADLRDQAVLAHHNLVAALDGGQTVGYEDGCAAQGQLIQALDDLLLRLRVERARGFIADQQPRRTQERSRDRDALFLPSAELEAALADAARLHDQAHVKVRHVGALQHLGVRRLRAAIPNVLHDSAIEKDRLLGHDRHRGAQALQRQVADLHAVELDTAARHVVLAREQLEDGGFAAAAGPHDGNALARLHAQREATEDLSALAV